MRKLLFFSLIIISSFSLKASEDVACCCFFATPVWLDYIVQFANEFGQHMLPDTSGAVEYYNRDYDGDRSCDGRPEQRDRDS